MLDENGVAVAAETPAESSATEPQSYSPETTAAEETATEETRQEPAQETSPEEAEAEKSESEQPDEQNSLSEWTGNASARIRELCKLAPGLDKALNANPKLRDSIAAAFKRDAALRDRNVTIAEIDEYRSRCINGIQDLEAMERSLAEANELDDAFFARDASGNYPGHAQFLENLLQQDRAATLALLRRTPKDWARIDPDSYSETFGKIIASTFESDGVADLVGQMYSQAKQAGNAPLVEGLTKLWNYIQSFSQKRTQADPEVERLRKELEQRDRAQSENSRKSDESFHSTLMADAVKNHRSIVNEHRLMKALPQAISKEKRARIVDLICNRIEQHLGKSYSFNNKIREAYTNRDASCWHDTDKKGWQPWLVDMYVRRTLNEETPGIVQGNQAVVRKKTAARGNEAPRNQAPKPGVRERLSPNDYTPEEIARGQVPEEVMDKWIRANRPDAAKILGR